MGTTTKVIKTIVDDYDDSELTDDADTKTLELTWRGTAYKVVTSVENAKIVTEWLDSLTNGADEQKTKSKEKPVVNTGEPKENALDFALKALDLSGHGSITRLASVVDAYLASLPEDQRPKTELTKKPIDKLSKQSPQKNLVSHLRENLNAVVAFSNGESEQPKKSTNRAKAAPSK